MINYLKKIAAKILKRGNEIKKPMASKSEYLNLHEDCKKQSYNDINNIEKEIGFAIDKNYFEKLALHTQVCIKKSKLNYQHGRILYSYLRKYIDDNFIASGQSVNILETGTARGFSSICMSKAILDSGKRGNILTCDILPNNKKIYWNCIDDLKGKKTRNELLSPWGEELNLITFLQGETIKILPSIDKSRIHFAFLDAQHKYDEVKFEFDYVSKKQLKGDYIIFDDVTENIFPGVVKVVKEIEKDNEYQVNYISVSDQRGYAIIKKII